MKNTIYLQHLINFQCAMEEETCQYLNKGNSVTINNQGLPGITTIRVEGYRSLEDVHIELRRINILIGANGSGKSNFISFFDLIRAIIQSGLQIYIGKHGGANAQFFLGTKHTKHISAKIEMGENTYEFKLSADTNDGCYFEEESITFWSKRFFLRPSQIFSGGSGHRETRLFMGRLPRESTILQSFTREKLESWFVYHFHDTGDYSPLKRTAKIDDIAHLYPDGSNLAAYLYHLQKNAPEHYHGIISAIQLILPGFQDFTYLIQSDNITIQWKTTTSGDYALPISAFSDGTLRFIAIATLFLQPTPPKLIIIDEPELGLHPYAISILAEFVHNASRKSQVIISTQSTQLVSEFSPEDIIITENTNNATTFRHLSSFEALKEWMNDYTLGDIWWSNLIGGNP